MNPKKESRLLKFTKICFHLARQAIPEYRSKFSKHTFTQPQHIVLNALRIRLNLSYRDFVDLLEEMPRVRETLSLEQIPHFTTVQKASDRLSTAVWRVLLKMSVRLFPKKSGIAGIDASGYERHYASHYYTRRAKLKISSIKTTILVDLGEQMVLDLHMTTTRKHDTQIAPGFLKRNRGSFHVLTADKGYDDGGIRAMLRGMKIRPLIKHREFKPYDKAANARMDKSLYHRRSLLESVNSVVKRKYGSWVRSRAWGRQFREIVAKHLIYNIERALNSLAFLFLYLGIIFKLAGRRISTKLQHLLHT
jgi:IS5 family transposase